ncbi:hypothetical protein V3330_11275 [Wenzhouxiangellaceae bacterium CH-27]|uniref:Glycosyltransferase RgtA/B/C/D-like domain-containing protein n=2 Tax=Elongatibacter sediminis TaxID=3119006 RepID=A0AAW9RDL8_9GAMM
MNVPHSMDSSGRRKLWLGWFVLCLAVVAVHATSMDRHPPVTQDEVQIVELGRAALQPDTDWSMVWNIAEERTAVPLSYVGKVFQEWAYQATQPSHLGTRITALFWAVLAATAVLGWLQARGAPPWAALALAFACLTDPMFTDIFRAGRIDGAAFAACLGACWLIRAAGQVSETRARRVRLVAAGGLLTLSPFLWTSVVLLFPLVLVELGHGLIGVAQRGKHGYVSTALSAGWPFVAACAGASALLLLPVWLYAPGLLEGMATLSAVQARAAAIQSPVYQLFLVYSPLVFCAALLGLLWRREWPLLIALAASLWLTYQTMVYPARVIYLLPYLWAIIAGACQVVARQGLQPALARVPVYLLGALVAWNAITVLVLRPLPLWRAEPSDTASLVYEAYRDTIGPGPHRVLLEDWSSYYAARQLGWKVYRAGTPVSLDNYQDFMSTLDYVIVHRQPLYDTTRELVREAGYSLIATTDSYTDGKAALEIYRVEKGP